MSINNDELPHVVLLTGLLSPAWTFLRFKRSLQRKGYQVSVKSYGHLRQPAEESARDLGDHIDQLEARQIQLVAHSFGGVVLLHLLEQSSELRLARLSSLVFLGSPLKGCEMAAHLTHSRLGAFWRFFLGDSLRRGLDGNQPAFRLNVPHALIAGTSQSVLSRMLNPDMPDGDGLVTLPEAIPENTGSTESEVYRLAVSHAALLYDGDCIQQVLAFLAMTRH